MFRVTFDFRGVARASIDVAAPSIEVLLWWMARGIDSGSGLTNHSILLLIDTEFSRRLEGLSCWDSTLFLSWWLRIVLVVLRRNCKLLGSTNSRGGIPLKIIRHRLSASHVSCFILISTIRSHRLLVIVVCHWLWVHIVPIRLVLIRLLLNTTHFLQMWIVV